MPAPSDQKLWQHVSKLRPQLRQHVRLLAQDYRHERWYLLHDESAGRFLRFNTQAYELLGRLDGDLTVQEILDQANEGREQDALTPDDVMQILAQLHAAEVLRGGLPVSAQEVLHRYQQSQRFHRRRALRNPLALRIPFFDPDNLLTALTPLARPLFSWFGLSLWLAVVGFAVLLALANLGELTAAVGAKTLDPAQVLAFWMLFPLIKALHELGHGLAVKVWGGEVHETGITLLVFMPVPYVDASAAWVFRDKRRRALVGAAGILVELFLAAVGLLVWVLAEPGVVREAALNVALIGGVSTLLFNGNPLLRFDGYYVTEDLLEIPNLASRATRYYLYLIQRYALGLVDARSPVTAHGERAWFAVYGLAAPVYRLFVLVGIAFYLAGEFLVVGVVLASWAVLMQLVRPLYRAVSFLVASPRLAAHRVRGFAIAAAVIAFGAVILLAPAPLVTRAQGVVWLEQQSQVFSASDGFVIETLVPSGSEVRHGDLLLRLEDLELKARYQSLRARLRELKTQQASERLSNRVRAAIVGEDIEAGNAELAELERRLAALDVTSPGDGRFVFHHPHQMQGRFVRHGDVLGYLIEPKRQIVRAVVRQDRIGLLRSRETAVEVVLSDRLGAPVPATILREVPAGSDRLPSRALGAAGGGGIAVDMRDESGRTAAEHLFQVDLALPQQGKPAGIGSRAYVRLDHGKEPLWRQWARGLRQLFLSRLNT